MPVTVFYILIEFIDNIAAEVAERGCVGLA